VAVQELEDEDRGPGGVAAAGDGERRLDVAEAAEDLRQLLVERFVIGKAGAGLPEAGRGFLQLPRPGQRLGEDQLERGIVQSAGGGGPRQRQGRELMLRRSGARPA
jgi:hypothetical protein